VMTPRLTFPAAARRQEYYQSAITLTGMRAGGCPRNQ